MSHPQSSQRPSQNGVGRRRIDKDVSRSDNLNWRQPVRTPSNSNSSTQGGNKGTDGRLIYMYTCLIGQHVEVQKIDGHVYSGIFHAASTEKESGVILKMARLIKEGGHSIPGESVRQAARKPPIRTYVIPGKDFVQIIAKDVSLSGDALSTNRARENRSDIVTDSVVSQGWHRESERELKPWKPDDESSDTASFNLSKTWSSGNWDQFEANKALFGVETTFDEDLYTTKIIRGPQTHEREREAQRIAREIVGQQTRNMHLAEERGLQLGPEQEVDEETKYSSVGRGYQDEGDDDEDQHMDDHNDETFGGSGVRIGSSISQNSTTSTPISGQADGEESSVLSSEPQIVSGSLRAESSRDRQDQSLEKEDVGSPDSFSDAHIVQPDRTLRLRKLLVGDKSKHINKGSGSPYNSPIGRGSPLMSPLVGDPAGIKALNLDPSCPQVPDDVMREFNNFKQQKEREYLKGLNESFKEMEPRSPRTAAKGPFGDMSKEGNVQPASHDLKSNLAPMSAATQRSTHASAPPPSSLPLPTSLGSSDKPPTSLGLVSIVSNRNATSVPCSRVQTSGPFLSMRNQIVLSSPNSPSSSTASLPAASASKKSPLNMNAKEFKLNPNAKAFTPSLPPARSPAPVAQHPGVPQSPVNMHSNVPVASSIQGSPMNLQSIVQQNQFSQFNHVVASGVVASNSAPYMQPWCPVPGFPVGVGGSGILPGQPNMRVSPHSQQQAMSQYGHPQQVKYPSPTSPMQPGLLHPNGHMYPQHMMYGPPANPPVVYMQYPQK